MNIGRSVYVLREKWIKPILEQLYITPSYKVKADSYETFNIIYNGNEIGRWIKKRGRPSS